MTKSKRLVAPASLARNKVLHHEITKTKTGERLSDTILGGQDGLVNTLGVILGIAAASNDFRIIMAGALAGAIAESISMAAVGYTSKLAEKDFYISAMKHEQQEIDETPEHEKKEVREIYAKKGFKGHLLDELVETITADRKLWLDTMMREELGLSEVDGAKPWKAAVLIGLAAFLGSIIPLLSFAVFYFAKIDFPGDVKWAIYISIMVSALSLFILGAVKSKLTIGKWYRSGAQMVLIGILSALVGYFIGAMFSIPAGVA
jgi:predicted membrane protein (TIGR00267 family)